LSFKASSNKIKSIVNAYASEQDEIKNNPKYVMTLFSDNSVTVMAPKRDPTYVITTIYSPPSASDIV